MMAIGALLFPVYGQEAQESPSKKITDYRLGSWRDNWFISAGGGVNFVFADDNRNGDIFKQMTPAANFAIGKWITPVWGARLQYNGVTLRGYHNAPSIFNDGYDDSQAMYKNKMNYVNLHGDILLSFTNWTMGYKPNRGYELIGFGGVGWTRASKGEELTDQVGFTVGLINRFRLSDHWDFNIEATSVLLNDKFNDVDYGFPIDLPLSLSVGFTYKFGAPKHQGFKSAGMTDEEKARMTALQKELDESKANNDTLQKQNDELKKQNEELNNKPAAEVQPTTETAPQKAAVASETVVFFDRNKAILGKEDKQTLTYAAEQIKSNPDVKFVITGYADSSTGTAEYNQQLSEKRAQAVYDQLVKNGVNKDQLTMEGKGGIETFKDDQSLNRVAIVKVQE